MDRLTYGSLALGRYDRSRRRHNGTISSRDAPRSSGASRRYDDRMSDHDEPRRSGRQRKLMYDTFDQNLITMINKVDQKPSVAEEQGSQKRGIQRSHVCTRLFRTIAEPRHYIYVFAVTLKKIGQL